MIAIVKRTVHKLLHPQKPSLSKRQANPISVGLPPSTTFELVNDICIKQTGQRLHRVSYQHLSGWKATGAFRLFAELSDGQKWTVIFKNAVYDYAHIPAVDGLPVRPGPPEYAVYAGQGTSLSAYLPEVYWAATIIPGKHYRYFLEDLHSAFKPLSYSSPDIPEIAARLPALHAAMQTWQEEYGESELLEYGPRFSEQLAAYAAKHMDRYLKIRLNEDVKKFMGLWDRITAVYQQLAEASRQVLGPVHGDLSPANIYVSQSEPVSIKVLDWEWAGVGFPQADLAALVKRSSPELEQRALFRYCEEQPALTVKEHRQLFEWCQLERGILDAGFLAKQQVDSTGPSDSVDRYISRSLQRAWQAYQTLTADSQ